MRNFLKLGDLINLLKKELILMNFIETIFLFFSFLALILAILFFIKKKGDKISNVLLGVYLLLFAFNIVYNVLYWTEQLYPTGVIHLVATQPFIRLSYGPILYLYIKRVVYNVKFRPQDVLHFIPALFILVNMLPFSLLSKSEKGNVLLSNMMPDYFLYYIPNFAIVIIALQLIYFILIRFTLKKSIISLNRAKWLNWLSYSFLGYCLSFACYFVLLKLGSLDMGQDYFIVFSMIFFIGLVSYFGFLQPQVFDGLSMDKIVGYKKYRKTGLTNTHSLEIVSSLKELLNTHKPYLNNELKLDSLAVELNLSRNHLSQVINQHFDTNFFDFINKYRVEEAKKLLKKEPDLNVKDVVYKSGFNNRVSFNKAFKRHTGVTPTQYKS